MLRAFADVDESSDVDESRRKPGGDKSGVDQDEAEQFCDRLVVMVPRTDPPPAPPMR